MNSTSSPYLQPVNDGLILRSSGSWAARKLDYLRRYIDIFETSMKGKWYQRNYIDLFSGPGKNKIASTGEILLGSPLLALTTRFPFSSYYFSELDQKNKETLELRCSVFSDPGSIHIYKDDANRIASTIVSTIRQYSPNSLNLAFLDPDGLELEWSTVAMLGQLRCDLIIHYSQQGIKRYISQAYMTQEETRVDRFFGTPEWRKIYSPWHDRPRKMGLQRDLLDFYKDRLASMGYKELRQSDQIQSEPLIRNEKRNAPLYRLIFASKSPLGDEFWRKITKRDVYGQKQLF